LKYGKVLPGCWRFFDTTDRPNGAAVGPHYPTKELLLADMRRYGMEYGFPEPE
jgi:hypothetical protein